MKRFITLLFLFSFLSGYYPAHAAPKIPQTFADYGYKDRTASTMFGALEYYFPVPENVTLKDGAALDLIVSHSPLLRSNRSTMTVIVNDVAVYSAFLDAANLDHTVIHIPLPVDGFQNTADRREGYVVLVQFFMRLSDIVCEETSNPALWATVYGDSTLTYESQPRANPDDLALLPYPFIVKNSLEVDRVAFNLSQKPTSAEINAAANVAAYLGANSTRDLVNISAQTNGAASDQPTIAIQSNSGASSLTLGASNGQALLTLGGDSPLLASEALLHPELFNQLQGQSVQVRKNPDASLKQTSWAWKQDAATFAQLDAADRTAQGVGAQSLFLNFTRPAGWKLTTDSIYLDLHLTRSPLLLAESSGVKVKINGMDMGSVGYYEASDANGFYRFNLPADVLNVGFDGKYTNALNVELIFEHQLKQANCEPIYAENAWTTVHADSYFYLAHDAVDLPDISVFPYPFIDPNRADPIQIILPSAPSGEETNAALTVAQLIGKNSYGITPELIVAYADQIKTVDGNAILIGTAERNHWINEIESNLPQERRGLVQSVVTNDAIGNLKEVKSPWSTGKWALIISGASDLHVVASALGTQLPSASVIAIRKDKSAEPLFRDVSAPVGSQPASETRPPLIPKPETWQVVLGVFVITALLVFIVMLIYRRRNA
jgi:hypothetical protein